MHMHATQLNNLAVMSLRTSTIEARIYAPIITMESLRIIGFKCKTGSRQYLLRTDDIRGFASDAAVIDSTEDLSDPGDLVRLTEELQRNYSPLRQIVKTQAGHKIGFVKDYTFDALTLHIDQIMVRPPFWQLITSPERIISRSQIVNVDPTGITVKGTTNPAPASSTRAATGLAT